LHDVVPAKDIVPPEGCDVLDVAASMVCRVSFSGRFYKATVLERGEFYIPLMYTHQFTPILCIGTYREMTLKQKEIEKVCKLSLVHFPYFVVTLVT
jgi:hypothetical protein